MSNKFCFPTFVCFPFGPVCAVLAGQNTFAKDDDSMDGMDLV